MSRESDDLMDLPTRDLAKTEAPEAEEDLEDLALGEDYALNPEFVPMVADALDRGDAERLRELLGALHPADIADLMGFLSAEDREELLPHLDPEALAEILSELDTEIREEVLEHVPSAILAKALGEMESDDAADVVDDLEADKRAQVLAAMPDIERAAIESSLGYADETAGRLMQREVVAAPQFWTVGQTIDHLRRESDELPELFFDVYVVDPTYKPVGAAPVSHLLRSKRDVPLAQIMEPVTEIPVDMDQEEVAYIFNKYHLISAPVVEPGGRLVGQITVDDIVGVIQEESEEDILALAGVSDAGRDAGIFGIIRSRLPWLVVNLITEAIAVTVIAPFQEMVAKFVALIMLMPIVSSLGGNAGTQALTVAVRAIASRELSPANAFRVILREVAVGIFNGAAMGGLLGLGSYFLWRDPRLSLVVALAIMANFFVAALGGILAPIVLDRMGRDPAVSSSVVVTFMTDFFGFLALLGIAALILL
jgi:magnesium transporter